MFSRGECDNLLSLFLRFFTIAYGCVCYIAWWCVGLTVITKEEKVI